MNKRNDMRRSLIVAAATLVLAQIPIALAEPVAAAPGPTQLPTSGLIIDLPAAKDRTYKLSGSWALDAAGEIFDTRDVVDEFDSATGSIVAGNWIMIGYFNAGDCAGVLAEMNFASPVSTTEALWGQDWQVLTGVFDFDSELGRRPAAALCRVNGEGQALLLERFLVNQPENLPYSALMADVRASDVLASASRSYSANRHGDIQPLRRAEVRSRGEGSAVRTLFLPMSGLDLKLPDDGYLWLLTRDDSAPTDMLNRLLPTLPEVTVEIMAVDGYACSDVIASFDDPSMTDARPSGLPAGWQASPGVMVESELELIACHDGTRGAILVGIFQGMDNRDVSPLVPLLNAVAAADAAR
jgi:hypothetical protein